MKRYLIRTDWVSSFSPNNLSALEKRMERLSKDGYELDFVQVAGNVVVIIYKRKPWWRRILR